MKDSQSTFDRLALAGVVIHYVILAAHRLDVPIPGYDEAIYVPPAICDRPLRNTSFVLDKARKFPDAPDAPVYAVVRVHGVR